MQFYGNEIWNRATDNRDKSLVTISVHDFPKLMEQLEQAGMNFYGYERTDSVVMALNDSDVEWFRRVAGVPDIEPVKSNRPYSPPEKNIIGNAEYRYIPDKKYLSSDSDMILKTAEVMAEQGIKFSGRIYSSGKGTLTVSHGDLENVREILNDIRSRRSQHEAPEKDSVQDNSYLYMTKLTAEEFGNIRMYLETSVNYHAVIRDGKTAFAIDKNDAPAFHRAIENAEREHGLLISMADTGLSLEQLSALSPVMHRLAVEDVKLDLTGFFNERYDDDQFGEMLSLVEDYLAQSPVERYGEHSKLGAMLEAKSSFDRALELNDFFSEHDFTDEQKAAVAAMFTGDVTRGQIDSIDETFTAEDIQAYDEILHTALQESDVADFLSAHRQAAAKRENAVNTLPENEPDKTSYRIYQLKEGEEYHSIRFERLDRLRAVGVQLNHDDYDLVYEGELEEFKGDVSLEDLFTKFNIAHPEDFRGHSLSVSDVIVISDNGTDTAYFCDSFGFKEIPEFFLEKEIVKEEITEDYKAITLNYKGDAESLAVIRDKALSLGASVLADNAEGTLSVDTYENHKTELDTLAYTLGLLTITEFTSADIDEPLFTDADVIEDIQRNENSDVPFRDKPDLQGEQLSLFGESVSVKFSGKSKENTETDFASLPVIDGVSVLVALAAEIERGTGFVHGKFRVQDFYEKSRINPGHPTRQELADFLKKEYGTGGHSGDGNMSLVDYNSKGMTFSFRNGEKFRHSWNNVAAMVEQHLKDNAYLSINEKMMWQEIKAERAAEEFEEPEPVKVIPETTEDPEVSDENITPDKGENFTITDDSLGEGGAKTKFRANTDAIRTLKALESENRPATAAEKETLSKYVGWGAIPQAFDSSAEKWSSEYKELSDLLTPEEYRQARSSVNDAFYTSPAVIDGIYEALGKFGFDGGNVLEPAMGIGNFFGRMPEDMQKNSHLYGVEIDSLSGRIAQALYPDAEVSIRGFEQNTYQNGCFDVAVGNVPFGELGFVDSVHGTTKLHDYFFAETLDNVSVNYG